VSSLADDKLLHEKELVKWQADVSTMSKMQNAGELRFVMTKWKGEEEEEEREVVWREKYL
jgi:hypothetical protein